MTVTRAEAPPERLTEREIEEAGFLTPEKRAARDAALAEERAAAIQSTLVWAIGLVAFEAFGIGVSLWLPLGWLRTAALVLTLGIGSVVGAAIVRRWRSTPNPFD